MLRKLRRNHSPVFKSQATLEALKGGDSASELAQQFNVSPNQISQWRTQLLERAGVVLEVGERTESPPVDIKALHAKIAEPALNPRLEGLSGGDTILIFNCVTLHTS